ncbi:MAG: Fe-S cluster protector protein [Nitrososphaerota archaeon]
MRISCSRCGKRAEAAEENPYRGTPLGERIAKHVCVSCWSEWSEYQLMLINEHNLVPAVKEHRAFLVERMKEFLRLPS